MKSNSCFKLKIEYGVIISHRLPPKHNHCLASAVQQQDSMRQTLVAVYCKYIKNWK